MIKRITYSFFCLSTITLLLSGFLFSFINFTESNHYNSKKSEQKIELKNTSNPLVQIETEEENEDETHIFLNKIQPPFSDSKFDSHFTNNPILEKSNSIKYVLKNIELKSIPIWLSVRKLIL